MRAIPKVRTGVKWTVTLGLAMLIAAWAVSGYFSILWKQTEWLFQLESGAVVGLKAAQTRIFADGWYANESAYSKWHWWFGRVPYERVPSFIVPLWPLVAALGVAAFLAWRPELLAVRRGRAGLCPKCSYDRAGLDSTAPCPECNAAGRGCT